MSENLGWITTRSGRKFYPCDPKADDIDIHDICHALAHICRFGAHTKHYYSVAEHSVWVSRLVLPEHALEGLLHDAAEAYIGDMCRPIKHMPFMQAYREMESKLEEVIAARFGLKYPWPDDVKHVDNVMCAVEAIALMGAADKPEWQPWIHSVIDKRAVYDKSIKLLRYQPAAACTEMTNQFYRLTSERSKQ